MASSFYGQDLPLRIQPEPLFKPVKKGTIFSCGSGIFMLPDKFMFCRNLALLIYGMGTKQLPRL
jgi:hypothetical protein